MEIPVYVINGFLEAGKTTFIKTTLQDPEFTAKDKILIIACEEGMEEYDEDKLRKWKMDLVIVDDKESFTEDFLVECQNKYKPDKVIIEMNGVWSFEEFLEMDMPKGWVTVQIITMVDAETFPNYINNMRGVMMEQVKYSDTIIFNRCSAETNKTELRRTVKPVNRKAQILYETANGIEMGDEEDELPFDTEADTIVIEDDDFGLWYLDAMDHPKKYEGKTVCFTGMVYKDRKFPADTFIPGRFAMQCCADDIAFIGYYCRIRSSMKEFLAAKQNRSWVYVKAKIKLEFKKEYRGKGPVLYCEELTDGDRPIEEIVYFT